MANSYEIAQMFAQQNSMFAGQQQFAQQIGVPPPPGVLGQMGMGGAGGLNSYGMTRSGGGGFNWGQPPMMGGYGPGNAVSANVMSGIGAAYSGGSMALGAAGMFGMLGRAGAIMDPFAWGARGFSAMGGGLAGGAAAVGMAALPVAAGMAMTQGVQSFVHGGQQQSQLNTMLGSQYNFFNPVSRTGQGFSRDDAKAIGDMVRQISHVPEMMSSMEELTNVMARLKGSGVMQGVKNAADFQARFREAISTIRDTAKIMGTTMEEAENFFTQSRGAGFYGRQSQLRNAISAQFTSSVTGASVGQVLGLQHAGADMAMQFGARRGLGATAVTNIAQNIGLAQQSGRINEGMVEDVTGLQGPEANMALAQRMFQGMMRFGQTPAGRLAMAGMMKFEGDKAVGVDKEMAQRFNEGLISVDELKARASRLTDKQKISYTARQSDLIASLAGQIGPGGAYGMMHSVLGQGRGEEATNLIMQRLTGMSAGEIDIAKGLQGVSGEGEEGMMARFRMNMASRREATDPRAVLQKIKTRLHAATLGKLEQAGASVQTSIAKTVDEFFDDLVGREVSTLTEDRAKAIAAAFSGGGSQEAKNMLASLSGTNISKTGGGVSRGTSMIAKGAGMYLGGMFGPLGAAAGYFLGDKTAGGLLGGGSESIVARTLTNLGGGLTSGQEQAYARDVFGIGPGEAQNRVARLYAKGKVAGTGAQDAIAEILSEQGFEGKSQTQRLQAVTEGLQSRVGDVLQKLGFSKYGQHSTARLFSGEEQLDIASLEKKAAAANLSSGERKLIQSYIAANKNKMGGNIFAQMAAASGMGEAFANIAGGADLGAQASIAKSNITSAENDLKNAVGETAAGYLKAGGTKAKKMFQAAVNDSNLKLALVNGDTSKARALLAQQGMDINDKEMGELTEAVRGFSADHKDATKVGQALQSFETAAGNLASIESRTKVADYGSHLLATSVDAGAAAGAQKELGAALQKLGQEGRGVLNEKTGKYSNIEAYQTAFEKYAAAIQGIQSPEARAAAEAAGGTFGGQVESMMARVKAAKTKRFSSNKEVASYFGVDVVDVADVVGSARGTLTEAQIKKLSAMGAERRASFTAISGEKAPERSEQQKLLDTLMLIDKNQSAIATVLATIKDLPDAAKKQLLDVAASTKENANAGKGGQTVQAGDNK